MLRAAFIFMAVMAVSPAFAQNKEALCEFLPVKEHFVGADYVPGVDVHGNAVVPADVKAQANSYVDVIKIPVTLDLAADFADVLPQGAEMDAQLTMIEIQKDSKVLVNGNDITDRAYAYCNKEPFDIHSASVEPEQVVIPEPIVVPEQKPEKEEIIWGEAY